MTNDILGLYGPEDSKYLRLVARRAEAEAQVQAEKEEKARKKEDPAAADQETT